MTISALPASYDNYIKAGWSLVPIPPGTKGPRNPGWNKRENSLISGSMLPPGYGVGLAHAYSGTCALDVDEWDSAVVLLAENGIDLQALYSAHDAVTIESGRKGHGKLLYRMPFGMTLPSKTIKQEHEGTLRTIYELRCASQNGLTVQDVIPPSIHPDTNQPYQFGGKGRWDELPMCPIELLTYWDSLLQSDATKSIPLQGQVNTSWDEVRSALFAISADCSRETWVSVGMALHAGGVQMQELDYACALWDEWSAQSLLKYKGPQDIQARWRSFRAEDGITLGTLFHHARLSGWTKPIADASMLFSAAKPASPKVAGAYLRPAAPDVDLTMWPEALVKRAMEISETRGCDPLVPLMAGLGAVCGAVDSRIRLELMHEYKVPPILWIMTIGEPADKKTPGSDPMFTVLTDIEVQDRDRYKAEMLAWECKEAAYASAKKQMLLNAQNPLESLQNEVTITVPPLPPQPVPMRIIVSDITSQKLVRNAADRPRGLLCYLDEMAGWMHKITDRNSGDDRSAWVQSYEGKPYRFDRVTAGTIDADHFAVSIYGNVQPKVFRDNLKNLSADGLLQRFIPVCLRPEYTMRGEPVASFMSGKVEYEDLVRKMYTIPEQIYTLSPDAYRAYREFQLWYESLKQDERIIKSNDVYMTALGKIEGTCGRVALVFHLISDPYNTQVSLDTMTKAINVIKGFIIPSYRHVYNVMGGVADDSLDQWIIDHIIQLAGERATITLSDLRRSARRRLEGIPTYQAEQDIRVVMDWLATQNWVSLIEDTKRSMVWAINAELANMFDDYRTRVIEAKQRTKDIFVNVGVQNGTLKPGTQTRVIGNR